MFLRATVTAGSVTVVAAREGDQVGEDTAIAATISAGITARIAMTRGCGLAR